MGALLPDRMARVVSCPTGRDCASGVFSSLVVGCALRGLLTGTPRLEVLVGAAPHKDERGSSTIRLIEFERREKSQSGASSTVVLIGAVASAQIGLVMALCAGAHLWSHCSRDTSTRKKTQTTINNALSCIRLACSQCGWPRMVAAGC